MNILIGYELGTGETVTIPRDHMAVTGRTQESGKSTTIEALVSRSKAPALAFVTKRGEKSFRNARLIPPFYRDKIDPDSIAALLSSAVGEKMQAKLGEIIWLCEGHRGGRGKNTYSWPAAHSLAEVLKNCETALDNATDRESQRLYTVLRHYLRGVVKQVATLPKSARIDLEAGLNVMDLREFDPGTQSLIIHDSVMWVAERGRGVTTIIPEAWKFVGQGKRSPVLAACEELIRQGGTLGNYLWLDSQDLVLHTNVLRSVGVYILGVQRERNEVKRVLDYIPDALPKLKPSNIQKLDVGQFWVCFKRKTVLTYVMPAWGTETYCRSVALGMASPPEAPKAVKSDEWRVTSEEPEETPDKELVAQTSDSDVCGSVSQEDDEMWKEKYEEAMREIEVLKNTVADLESALRFRDKQTHEPVPADGAPGQTVEAPSITNHKSPITNPTDLNGFYQSFKARLLADPQAIIALKAAIPEIQLTIARPKIQIDGSSLPGRLAALISKGFFKETRTQSAVRSELKRTGADVNQGNLWTQLRKLKDQGFLTEDSSGQYKAVAGMQVNIVEV